MCVYLSCKKCIINATKTNNKIIYLYAYHANLAMNLSTHNVCACDMMTKINLWKHETFLIELVSTQIMSIRVYI